MGLVDLLRNLDPGLKKDGTELAKRIMAGAFHQCGAPGCGGSSLFQCVSCRTPMCAGHASGGGAPMGVKCAPCLMAEWNGSDVVAEGQFRARRRGPIGRKR